MKITHNDAALLSGGLCLASGMILAPLKGPRPSNDWLWSVLRHTWLPRRAKKARQERQAGDSAKRRKMTEDLERREKAFASERNEEQAARARLKVWNLTPALSYPALLWRYLQRQDTAACRGDRLSARCKGEQKRQQRASVDHVSMRERESDSCASLKCTKRRNMEYE